MLLRTNDIEQTVLKQIQKTKLSYFPLYLAEVLREKDGTEAQTYDPFTPQQQATRFSMSRYYIEIINASKAQLMKSLSKNYDLATLRMLASIIKVYGDLAVVKY